MKLSDPKVWLPVAVIAGFSLVGVILIVTASEVQTAVPEPVMLAVRVVTADPKPTRFTVRSQGTVAPRTESALIPEVSGPVVWTSPSLVSGGFFEANEPLLRIDRGDYETARIRARASLERAEGELEHANANLARLEGLAARDIASPSQLDDARRSARVSAATVDEARAQLRQAQRDLQRTEIRAPYSGRVREKTVDVGQFLSRGQSVGTIYATDYVEVRLPIPDNELAYLDVGLFEGASEAAGLPAARLSARFAGAEHTWIGRIVRTEGEIDAKSRMVHVVARVEKPYEPGVDGRPPLAVGLFVSAEINGPEYDAVVIVPREAIRKDGSVLIVDEKETLQRRPVEVLRIEQDRVMIRGDLGENERICVSSVRAFLPGMSVRVIEAPQAIEVTGEEAARS
jgi:RND family efflux transporter MFP subunit